MEIQHSKYGDVYGLVDGRLKYQNSDNVVDLGRNYAKFIYRYAMNGRTIKIQLGEPDRFVTTTDYPPFPKVITCDYQPAYSFEHSRFVVALIMIGKFGKRHWKDGLAIAGGIDLVLNRLDYILPFLRFQYSSAKF